jgi:CDP-diacylglycerol--serine O-phosphatidyltransferase
LVIVNLETFASLAGLACTLLAIYLSILGVYHAAMIGMIWAVAFDWADGLIARKMKGRTSQQGFFGGKNRKTSIMLLLSRARPVYLEPLERP